MTETRPQIYNCFSFNNELDILEMRFAELFDVVDRFVISEGNMTFGIKPKPYYFRDNLQRFAKYLSKVTHFMVSDWPALDPWSMEHYQRDCLMRGLSSCRDNDIIVITDADELPSAEAIRNYRVENGLQSFEMDCYYFDMHTKTEHKWTQSKIGPYSIVKANGFWNTLYAKEHGLPHTIIPNGGRHMSYFGDVNAVIKKIEDGAHQEYNTPEFKDPKKIKKAMEDGTDIFGRTELKYFRV